jgi:hypothetical protein
MKSIIKRILKETIVGNLIEDIFPELNDLKKKSNYNAGRYGVNTIYYGKIDKEYYFRLTEERKGYKWDGDNVIDHIFPKTLYINGRIYDEIMTYIPDENLILQWFNDRYKQNAGIIKRRSPLKER